MSVTLQDVTGRSVVSLGEPLGDERNPIGTQTSFGKWNHLPETSGSLVFGAWLLRTCKKANNGVAVSVQ